MINRPQLLKAIDFLQTEDFGKQTQLCTLMNEYGSDKGDFAPWGKGHRYAPFYNFLFEAKRWEVRHVLELGVGTNNEDIPSNMTAEGKVGASLYAWRDYFPNAQIFGADIDPDCLFGAERIRCFHCDQSNPSSINSMLQQFDHDQQFDIIIEDGLHTMEASLCFLEHTIQRLSKGGVYFIEDVRRVYLDRYEKLLSKFEENYSLRFVRLVRIPDLFGNRNGDNNLVVMTK